MMTTQQIPGPSDPAIVQQVKFTLDPLGYLDQCVQQYGDIFAGCFFGNIPTVIVSRPDHLQQLFNPKTKVLDAPGSANAIFESQLGNNSLIVQDGKRHQEQRKLLMPPFHGEKMFTYGALISEITETVFNNLTIGNQFIAREITEEITITVILKVIFGLQDGQRYQEIKELMTTWLEMTQSPISSSVLLFSFLQKDWGAWSPWGKYIRLKQRIYDSLITEIRERRQNLNEEANDILSLILMAKYDDGSEMTEEEIRDNLLTLLNAGHETTSTTLAWALYWIHRDSHVYKKLMNELETVKNNLDPLKISKLPYLTAVCYETMRIYPVVMSTFPRVTTKSIELDGYKIDPNTGILPTMYLTHQREDVYENPKQFNPERFVSKNYPGYEFLPFGAGSRQCLGRVFAEFEMKLILTKILLNYDLELIDMHSVKPTRRGFLLSPKGGIKMRIKNKK